MATEVILLDNCVIDKIYNEIQCSTFQFAITTRSNNDNPEYIKNYQNLQIIPNVARFGYSKWGGGEVWGGEETTNLSNKLLSLAANQKNIIKPIIQSNKNQRDDADIITAAIINKCKYLVSDDKKFMLKDSIKDLACKNGLTILSSDEFIKLITKDKTS